MWWEHGSACVLPAGSVPTSVPPSLVLQSSPSYLLVCIDIFFFLVPWDVSLTFLVLWVVVCLSHPAQHLFAFYAPRTSPPLRYFSPSLKVHRQDRDEHTALRGNFTTTPYPTLPKRLRAAPLTTYKCLVVLTDSIRFSAIITDWPSSCAPYLPRALFHLPCPNWLKILSLCPCSASTSPCVPAAHHLQHCTQPSLRLFATGLMAEQLTDVNEHFLSMFPHLPFCRCGCFCMVQDMLEGGG